MPRSRSRSRTPPRRRSRSRTPVMNSFSGLSLNQRQPPRLTRTRRIQRRIPSPVPGHRVPSGEAQRNDSFTSAFRRLNFDNQESGSNEQPPVPGSSRGRRFQQRVMSPRRTTKFWRFTKGGKRKSISRGSFLRSRRKNMKKRSKRSKRSYKKRSKRSKRSRSKRSRSKRSRSKRPCLRKSYAPGYKFDGTGVNLKTGKRDKFYIWPNKNCRQ